MSEIPPTPVVRTKSQLLGHDFFSGQDHILRLRNFIETTFDGTTQSSLTWLTDYGQRSLSARDRASEEVHLREFTGYDPSGASATNDVALAAAWAAMIARGRSRVITGPGFFRFGATPTLEKAISGEAQSGIFGAGPGVTSFIGPASGHCFNIGNLSGAQTGNLIFRDFSVVTGGAPGANDYAFAIEKCRRLMFENIYLHLPKNGWGIGLNTTLVADRSLDIALINCDGSLQSNPGGAWIRLVGGEQLHVYGGKTSGRYSQYFIHQAGTAMNSDGVYVLGHFSEQWGEVLRSTSGGIVNLRFYGGQFDRARRFIYMSSASGSCRDWQVNCQFLGHGAATVTITIASPGVVTWTAHDLLANDAVVFTTTGALPTGITAGTVYFVKDVLSADTFTISATAGGAVINTSGSQSGTHSGQERDAAAIHFDSTTGTVEAITIYGSAFNGRLGPVGRFIGNASRSVDVLFNSNTIRDSGNKGVPLFEIDANSNPNFFGNYITKGQHSTSLTPYTYAFNFAGASTGRRSTAANIAICNTVLDFATGVVNGTP